MFIAAHHGERIPARQAARLSSRAREIVILRRMMIEPRTTRRMALALLAAAVWPATAIAQSNEGPRPGRYRVYLVQFTTRTYTQDIVLHPDGRYEIFHPSGNLYGSGRYEYEAAQQRVRWLSGPNQELGRGGSFSIREGGRVHYILMGRFVYAINGE